MVAENGTTPTDLVEEKLDQARKILRQNDRGTYTIPARGLYPFQWNWDSCLTALGWATFDEGRAWTEIETLFSAQWDDGMVPHIVFHKEDTGYFPGPDVWATGKSPATSGITQPPVAATCVRQLIETARDKETALEFGARLVPKIAAWHRWFYAARELNNSGLVVSIHPWESGADNSVDWDASLANVPVDEIPPYERRDTEHSVAEHRPTNSDYDKYLTLVHRYSNLGWKQSEIAPVAPFRVADLFVNSLLQRSNIDLQWLVEYVGASHLTEEVDGWVKKGKMGLQSLWSEPQQSFQPYDYAADQSITSISASTFLPLFAHATEPAQTQALVKRLWSWRDHTRYLVPSFDPTDPRFDSKRYWRGPVWAIINWMISDGLTAAGHGDLAKIIADDTRALIDQSGFREYFDPENGQGLGGDCFSWTAAMRLTWLSAQPVEAD